MCVTNQGSPRIFIFFSFTLLPGEKWGWRGGGFIRGSFFLAFLALSICATETQIQSVLLPHFLFLFFFFSFPFSLSYPAKRQ